MGSYGQTSLFEPVKASGSVACKAAIVYGNERYRHSLLRIWGPGRLLYFVMLNPSTATADADDPTVRKCVGFAQRNQYDGIMIENVVPYRATDPKGLIGLNTLDLLGDREKADTPFRRIPTGADVVAAWGMFPYKYSNIGARMLEVLELLNRPLFCVKQTAGRPWHPLYVAYGPLERLNG